MNRILSALVAALMLCVSGIAAAQTVIKQSDPNAVIVQLGSVGVKGNVFNTAKTTTVGSLLSGVIVADYVVTATNVYYVSGIRLDGMVAGATVTTASDLGYIQLENPSGVALLKNHLVAYQGSSPGVYYQFAEPVPFAAGSHVRVTVAPNYNGSVEWSANISGYER